MPIRFVDRSATVVGRITTTLANFAADFDGTFAAAPGRTGTIAAQLQDCSAGIVGSFQVNANRIGTIASTLDGATSLIVGSVPGQTTSDVTSFQLTSVVGGSQPFMLGHGFKRGDVPNGQSIVSDTSGITLRGVVKRRWNDGSVKHAVLVGSGTFVANVAKAISLKTGSAAGGSNLTSASIQTAAPTASVQCGATGTVSLATLLASPFRTWISTPEMVECHYRAAVGASANLVVWFQVRLWASGRIWVRAYVENGYVNSSPSDLTYTATVIIGGVTVFNASLTHYGWTRWDQTGWIGTDPQITPAHNAAYLRSTKLVPNYWKINPSTSTLNGLSQSYTPMDRGPYKQNTSEVGGTFSIGPLQLQEALYCASASPQSYRATITQTRQFNAYSLYRKSSSTNRIPRMTDFPTTTYFGGSGNEQVANGGQTFDLSHAPNPFLAYLITGDHYFLETLGHTAQSYYFCRNAGGGSGVNRDLFGVQNRGIGWGFNIAGRFCALAPREDVDSTDLAVSTDFRTWFANVITDFRSQIDDVGQNQLGFPYAFSVTSNNHVPGHNGAFPPWMQDYWTGSAAHCSEIDPIDDLNDLYTLRNWMYRVTVGRLGPTGTDNYHFSRAGVYGVVVDPTATADEFTPDTTQFFDRWGQVWNGTYDSPNTETTNDLQGTVSSNPVNAPNGYWGYLLYPLVMAVDHGAIGALAGYRRLTGANNFSTLANSGFDDNPIFGHTPRTATSTLAQYANQLGPGQSIRLPITITAAQAMDGTAPIWKWGSSGVWDPTTREVMYVGKRQDTDHAYKFWTYHEDTNACDLLRNPWSTATQNGHGYDHNTIDPETGNFYHRPFNDGIIQVRSRAGVWSTPLPNVSMQIAIGVSWWPGLGLVLNDGGSVKYLPINTSSWVTVTTFPDASDGYHAASEYNPNSDVLLLVPGNQAPQNMRKMSRSLVVSSVPDAPFSLGSSESQGVLVADPVGRGFIGCRKGTSTWTHFNPDNNQWTTLTQSTGSGASAQNGTPNLTTGGNDVGLARIGIPISTYGVMMFLEYVGGGEVARIWLYRHT